jgi:hypothetical protein
MGGGLFGTSQGVVPLHEGTASTTFNPFAAVLSARCLNGAQNIFNSGGNGMFDLAKNQVRSTLNGDYLNPVPAIHISRRR